MRISLTSILCAVLCSVALAQPAAETVSPREVVSLDGTWQLGVGDELPPAEFHSTVPVPGLVDMATPAVPLFDVSTSAPKAYWYRRTFTIDRVIPAVALLKINKAIYGSKTVLNGREFEQDWSSYAPQYIHVKETLRQGENEVLIRVGAHPRLMPPGTTHGLDPERIKYIAGIFDSVELILSGSPRIVNVQAVPDITSKSVTLQALLQNTTGEAREVAVRFWVREAKAGSVGGSAEAKVMLPATSQETAVTVTIPIANCHLWSPADPFLYELTADCGTDQLTQRFGMRSFRLDQATGRAYLNGQPYFLRGSNITLYRFFEDGERRGLPWDREWVRGLHKKVRGTNWNSLRYCIGFPPDFWYDIADEEGILIQDEFPIWNSRHGNIPNDNDPARLIGEFTNWMRERWNHPCVVIWDAQNETHSVVTGQVIAAVRGLDLSNRPWDNGYGKYRLPGDSYESHPYLYNKPGFERPHLAWRTGTPLGNAGGPNVNDNPIILNEYAWLWLNRDGTPTRLSREIYARMFKGKEAGAEEHRHLYARLLAELTEFWRSHRACAGVLHFCILSYSRPPTGQTSDHFIDVKNLELEPHFERYTRDAFAPVGIMIDFWDAFVSPNHKREIGVAVINDLATEWSGEVHLDLIRDGDVVQHHVQKCIVPAFGRNELSYPLTFPRRAGVFQFKATLVGPDGKPVSSWRHFEIGRPAADGPTTAGLASGTPATIAP